jgi:hypothetical protein
MPAATVPSRRPPICHGKLHFGCCAIELKRSPDISSRALGAVAVTVPTCYYLLSTSPEEAHHPHLPTKPHGHSEEQAEEESGAGAPEEVTKPSEEEKEDTVKDDAKANPANKKEETGDASEKQDKGNNIRRHLKNDKGHNKLLIESTNATTYGTKEDTLDYPSDKKPADPVRFA